MIREDVLRLRRVISATRWDYCFTMLDYGYTSRSRERSFNRVMWFLFASDSKSIPCVANKLKIVRRQSAKTIRESWFLFCGKATREI